MFATFTFGIGPAGAAGAPEAAALALGEADAAGSADGAAEALATALALAERAGSADAAPDRKGGGSVATGAAEALAPGGVDPSEGGAAGVEHAASQRGSDKTRMRGFKARGA